MKALKKAIEKIADCSITQFDAFCSCRGNFARLAASQMTTPTWWYMYGGNTEVLHKYALRIVSQYVSSSGCEHNWSTFTLIHMEVRNRLGYVKLYKLVYVYYNLKLRFQQQEIECQEKDLNPWSMLMDATLYDQDNPITDWLSRLMREF